MCRKCDSYQGHHQAINAHRKNIENLIVFFMTKNIGLVKKLENLKYLLRKSIQPRLAWEIAFLKISMEDI